MFSKVFPERPPVNQTILFKLFVPQHLIRPSAVYKYIVKPSMTPSNIHKLVVTSNIVAKHSMKQTNMPKPVIIRIILPEPTVKQPNIPQYTNIVNIHNLCHVYLCINNYIVLQ